MERARAERRAKLDQADALLAGMDEFLLNALHLSPPAPDVRRVFAVPRHLASSRFDPHFHAPEFSRIQEMLSHVNCEALGAIATFSDEIWRPEEHLQPTFRYIEISTVNPKTGEASWTEVNTRDAPSRARMKVRQGDIIVSLTRPHHGSIAYLGVDHDGCIASTGFAVLRGVAEHVRRDFLWCVLRTQMCLRQMLQRASGGNYPAICDLELAKIVVPIPVKAVQGAIVAEASRRQREAATRQVEAEAKWQQAKRWFEEQLLGPAAP